MTVPKVALEDLVALEDAFPLLDFQDEECRAVLLANDTVDIQAAPGSGKTTILAARLYLLSRKWTDERSGICVISHTNVARDEIRKRLTDTPGGTRLLGHPHFIGTIHSFVNQFLALPYLRSAEGVVDCIDDDVFSRRALAAAKKNWTVKSWMDQKPQQAPEIVAGLRLAGETLDVTSSGGKLPSSDSNTGKFLRELKWDLCRDGIFRHDDMFAFAEHLLGSFPRMQELLAARFPLVMIDEMQDTSPSQERLLRKAFGDGVVMQRLGDINQRIFDHDEGDEATFPTAPFLSMSSSRRFGDKLAGIVSKVQIAGKPIVGKGKDPALPPTLLVYETSAVEKVIPRFGELVLKAFDDNALTKGDQVKAICARRSGEANQPKGRHVADFWAPLRLDASHKQSKQESARRLMAAEPDMGVTPMPLGDRYEKARRVILLALRQAAAPVAKNVKEPWRLFRELRETSYDMLSLRLACRNLVLLKSYDGSTLSLDEISGVLYPALKPLISDTVSAVDFSDLDLFSAPDAGDDVGVGMKLNSCRVVHNGRVLEVRVDTVAMAKGETHLATLLLESYGRWSKKFDVGVAASLIAGSSLITSKMSDSLKAQLRHVYVGVSRPTQLLCLAVNRCRLQEGDADKLVKAGWMIESVN